VDESNHAVQLSLQQLCLRGELRAEGMKCRVRQVRMEDGDGDPKSRGAAQGDEEQKPAIASHVREATAAQQRAIVAGLARLSRYSIHASGIPGQIQGENGVWKTGSTKG
jgi:hypothetical protein